MTIDEAQAAFDAAEAAYKAASRKRAGTQAALTRADKADNAAWRELALAERAITNAQWKLAELRALAADAWRPRVGQYVVADVGKDKLRLRRAGEPADRARWFVRYTDGTLRHRAERISGVDFAAVVAAYKAGKPAEVKP